MKYVFPGITLYALLTMAACRAGQAEPGKQRNSVRVATYNIQWFAEDTPQSRIQRIRNVISAVAPNVIGLQEIESRKALQQLFDSSWEIGIADLPDEKQELAVAVKKPFVLVSANLIFDTENLDESFPGGRDVLRCVVQTPQNQALYVYVVHMKSRRGGRKTTDFQRESACGYLAAYLANKKEEENTIVLGDFNDTPSDKSLNILESGNLLSMAGDNSGTQLLENLSQPLYDRDYVTEGFYKLAKSLSDPVVPGAKGDNDRLRNQDYQFPDGVKVPQALFDQILVSPKVRNAVTNVTIYAGSNATATQETSSEGKPTDLASDHLPVYADFDLQKIGK